MRIFRKKKTEKEKLFEMVHKTYFPGGDKQISEKSRKIVVLANDKLSLGEAKSLLLKSTMILVLNRTGVLDFIEREFGDKLEEKEIKSIVGYIMFNSSDERTEKIIDSGFGTDDMGYDDNEIPIGFGEFGRCLTNPIPVRGITANEVYLGKLLTEDDKKIKWERTGSREPEVKGIDGVIDIYKIFTEDKKDLGFLYIFPYNRKTSNKAPEGFKIDGGGIVVNSNKDLQNKINKAKEYKENKKSLEALGIYNQIFNFLCKEAANHAHKPDNFKDVGKTRKIFPGFFRDSKEFLKRDELACKISNNMGTIFAESGDIDSAESMFKQSIDLTPDDMDYKDPVIGLQNIKR
jgi:tetratricopeptide (TPR) repeat protein